jgi:CheY-like chemotaxis protein
VRADRQRLRQVLLNLGSNAVKYNEAGGTVAFTVEEAPQHRVRISVRDTGPGIPLEQQDMLFVPFSRLGAEHSGVEGTGVGLALSKQLVEVMGGTIGVDSAPGQGSTFWVELAAADHVLTAEDAGASASAEGRDRVPPQPGEVAVAGAGADGEVRTTLVVLQVEDDDSNASLVSLVLARRPQVRLLSAAQARLGLELARRHRPDLLLLDLHLPDLPGDELLHRARAMPELADTKIVVVSADATPQRIRRMLDLGVDGYLTKPLDVGALLQVIDDQLDRRAAGAR